jgi:ariadne-2
MHFEFKITHGMSTGIECIALNCELLAPEGFVLTFLTLPDIRDKYQQFAFRDYVQSHPQLRFCPGPNCQVVLRAKEPQARRAVCSSCRTTFCFLCGTDYHAPVDCETIKKWLKKCSDDSETAKYFSAHTKECPQCHVYIERVDGCNHMQCYKCKFNFCWMCLEAWKLHDPRHDVCITHQNNPNMAQLSAQIVAREALNKYLCCYEKWQDHSRKLKSEEQTLQKIESIIDPNEANTLGTWRAWQNLLHAATLLVKCRYTLKYTYPYSYYMEPGHRKEIFEFQQSQLEDEVQKLSPMVEAGVLSACFDFKYQVNITENRRATLLKEFLEV